MASSSNHYGDVANWVEKVIDSCKTPKHEIAARKLIQLFEDRIQIEAPDLYLHYSRRLRNKLGDKTYFRIETQLKENGKAN